MLILKRRCLESIKINSNITITVGLVKQNSILFSIEMPSYMVLILQKGCASLMPEKTNTHSKLLSATTAQDFNFKLKSTLENYPCSIDVTGCLENGNLVRFIFDAPDNVSIFRSEIYWEIMGNMVLRRRGGLKGQS